jgi:hypothetical protein
MQNVLTRRIPPVSSRRMDVPDVLSSVIAKMTMKNIEERYHSTSGLKHDLIAIRDLLSEGDTVALNSFKIGSKDISCFFNLPMKQFGREKERKMITDVIESVSKRRRQMPQFERMGLSNMSTSNSSYSAEPLRFEGTQLEDIVSDSTSSRGSDSRMDGSPSPLPANTSTQDFGAHMPPPTIDRDDLRPRTGSRFSGGSLPSVTGTNGTLSTNRSVLSDASSLYRAATRNSASNRMKKRRTRCDVVAISGSTGLGKSRLVQSKRSLEFISRPILLSYMPLRLFPAD